MAIWLDFDYKVERAFVLTGRWPAELMEEIGRHKQELFDNLAANPLEPDMLTVERDFICENRRFRVICAAHEQRGTNNGLRVIRIDELEQQP